MAVERRLEVVTIISRPDGINTGVTNRTFKSVPEAIAEARRIKVDLNSLIQRFDNPSAYRALGTFVRSAEPVYAPMAGGAEDVEPVQRPPRSERASRMFSNVPPQEAEQFLTGEPIEHPPADPMTDEELREANAGYHEYNKQLLKAMLGEEEGERLAEVGQQIWINEIQGRDPLTGITPPSSTSEDPSVQKE